LRAVNGWPSSSKETVITAPFGPRRLTSVIRDLRNNDVWKIAASSASWLNHRNGVTPSTETFVDFVRLFFTGELPG
jgi:hypothetical protein